MSELHPASCLLHLIQTQCRQVYSTHVYVSYNNIVSLRSMISRRLSRWLKAGMKLMALTYWYDCQTEIRLATFTVCDSLTVDSMEWPTSLESLLRCVPHNPLSRLLANHFPAHDFAQAQVPALGSGTQRTQRLS